MRGGGPAIHESMLTPLLLMGLAYTLLFVALLLVAMRTELAERRIARIEQTSKTPSKVVVS
jgi:heme exporter protein C